MLKIKQNTLTPSSDDHYRENFKTKIKGMSSTIDE